MQYCRLAHVGSDHFCRRVAVGPDAKNRPVNNDQPV